MHRDPGRRSLGDGALRISVVDEVGLGQHHRHLGAALVGEHHLPLEPPGVDAGHHRLDAEHHVHVGGERLGGECPLGRATDELGVAFEPLFHAVVGRIERHPVTGDHVLAVGGAGGTQLGDVETLTVRPHGDDTTIGPGHPPGDQVRATERLHLDAALLIDARRMRGSHVSENLQGRPMVLRWRRCGIGPGAAM